MGLHPRSDRVICELNGAQILCLANAGHKCKKKHVVIKISVQLTGRFIVELMKFKF